MMGPNKMGRPGMGMGKGRPVARPGVIPPNRPGVAMAKGGKVFTACSSCRSPAKCKAAGKCMMKGSKK